MLSDNQESVSPFDSPINSKRCETNFKITTIFNFDNNMEFAPKPYAFCNEFPIHPMESPSDQFCRDQFDASALIKSFQESPDDLEMIFEEEERPLREKKRKRNETFTNVNSTKYNSYYPEHNDDSQTKALFPIIKQPKAECTVGKNRACKVKIQLQEDEVQDVKVTPFTTDGQFKLPGFLQSIKITTTEVCVTFNGMKLLRQNCEKYEIPFETNMSVILQVSHPSYFPIFTSPIKLISKTVANPESKKSSIYQNKQMLGIDNFESQCP